MSVCVSVCLCVCASVCVCLSVCLCVCVPLCVCGDPKLQRALPVSECRGAGGTDETGTNKDAHQWPVKQRGTLRCVPAICDVLYSASRAMFTSFYRRCTLVRLVSLDALLTVRLKVSGCRCSLASDFISTQTTREPEPLEDPPAYFPFDASAES